MRRQNLLILWLLLLLTACKTDDASKLFTNLPPDRTGLHFSNDLTENEQFNIIKYLYFYNGGGVAIGDVNNDGLPDIYLTANQLPDRLYLNRGGMKFEDVTEASLPAGPSEERNNRWKTGVTMADVNADGWLDIYVCEVGFYKSVSGRNRLFINNKNGTFTERAEEFGLDFKGFSQQAAFFDYDLDGDLDCYLLNHSTHSAESFSPAANRTERDAESGDRLYRNDAPLGFTDVSERAGIFGGSMGYGLGLAVSDLNADGWPDIYATNDFHENDYLYLNSPQSAVLSPQPGSRIFREVIASATSHNSTFSMGVDAADLNNDGLPDLMTLDMRPDSITVLRASAGTDHYNLQQMKLQNGYHAQFPVNSLQISSRRVAGMAVGGPQNDGVAVKFSDVAHLAGVAATDWSWGPLLADYDNDGWKDIFITNGIWRRPNDLDYLRFASDDEVKRQATDQQLAAKMPSGKVANFAFRNQSAVRSPQSTVPTFENTSKSWGLDFHGCSNGAAYADLDLDGDLDLVVNNLNAPASIFRNNSEKKTGHSFLRIKLVGNQRNLFGIGAKVWVKAGGVVQFQELSPTRGWQSSSDHVLVFGVAKNEKLDEVRVVWPGGWQQILTNVAANQTLALHAVNAVELAKPAPAPKPIFTPAALEGLSHQENRFTDFNVEPLMPWLLSTQGPKLVTSANGWLYLCGAKGQAGQLGRFDKSQGFAKSEQPALEADFLSEDVDAVFFDADNDGDDDLYVVSGGGGYREGATQLRDRLYLNDGNFLFSRNEAALPDLAVNSSTAVPLDFDGDGDLDLFVGSRSLPGSYGLSPKSFLLKNNFVETGKLDFTDATGEVCPALAGAGMVTAAVWLQAEKQLVTAGEWTGLQVFDFSKLPAVVRPTTNHQSPVTGFWQTLEAADFDADGDLDLLAGNLGQNTLLAASPERPLELFVNDFDENGATDPIMTWYRDGRRYPLATKDALVQQLPFLRKKYVSYRAFAEATFEEIFDEKMLKNTAHLQATELRSLYFENLGNGQFEPRPLPQGAQVSNIHAFLPGDFDGDGKMDALAVGNFHGLRPDLGRADASYGHFLKGDGRGNFTVLPPDESGFFVPGEGRDLASVRAGDGTEFVVVARNNAAVLVYKKER